MTVTPDEARELLTQARVAYHAKVAEAHDFKIADLAKTVIAQAEQLDAKDAEIERLRKERGEALMAVANVVAQRDRAHRALADKTDDYRDLWKRTRKELDDARFELKVRVAGQELLLSIIDRQADQWLPWQGFDGVWWWINQDPVNRREQVPMTPEQAAFFADRNKEAQT